VLTIIILLLHLTLLFGTVMEALFREFGVALAWELFYTDDRFRWYGHVLQKEDSD